MPDNEARGADLKENVSEQQSYSSQVIFNSLFNCGIYDFFSKEQIERVVKDPIAYYREAVELSQLVYNKNGIVSNSVDYCTSLMTLDRVITTTKKKKTEKSKKAKELMRATLKTINDRAFIRDALFTEMLTGVAFYYFDVRSNDNDRTKYLTDYDIENITEVNEIGMNISIVPLPWQYTKIVGKKNGRYVLAFDLKYFTDLATDEDRNRKLKKYPKEIQNAYNTRNVHNSRWFILDNNHTMCRKIKSKDSEPWGRSLIIATLHDVLYRDYFIDTKRNTLDNVNNRIVYETYPENKQGTGSTLTRNQQEAQHTVVKQAINTRGKNGVTFFSLAAGTKMDSIDVSTDIFDSKNEANLNSDIAMNMGISAALIGAMTTGTYSGNVNNLEMITAQLYTWVTDWKDELTYVINKNVIKDRNNPVDIYYFPTSFVNRKNFFEMMKGLYTDAAGSLTFLIAASGVDPDIYMSVMDDELDDGIFEKYLPHQTSYTLSSNENVNGRPTTDNPSDNTVKSNNQNGNATPSPSD